MAITNLSGNSSGLGTTNPFNVSNAFSNLLSALKKPSTSTTNKTASTGVLSASMFGFGGSLSAVTRSASQLSITNATYSFMSKMSSPASSRANASSLYSTLSSLISTLNANMGKSSSVYSISANITQASYQQQTSQISTNNTATATSTAASTATAATSKTTESLTNIQATLQTMEITVNQISSSIGSQSLPASTGGAAPTTFSGSSTVTTIKASFESFQASIQQITSTTPPVTPAPTTLAPATTSPTTPVTTTPVAPTTTTPAPAPVATTTAAAAAPVLFSSTTAGGPSVDGKSHKIWVGEGGVKLELGKNTYIGSAQADKSGNVTVELETYNYSLGRYTSQYMKSNGGAWEAAAAPAAGTTTPITTTKATSTTGTEPAAPVAPVATTPPAPVSATLFSSSASSGSGAKLWVGEGGAKLELAKGQYLDTSNPQVDKNGYVTVAVSTWSTAGSTVQLKRSNGGAWEDVGGVLSTPGYGSFNITKDANGNSIAQVSSYQSTGVTTQFKKLEGNAWVNMGDALSGYVSKLTSASGGAPMIKTESYDAATKTSTTQVKKLDGNTWTNIGEAVKGVNLQTFSDASGNVALVGSGNQVKALQGGKWVDMGAPNVGSDRIQDMAFDKSGSPIVVFSHYNSSDSSQTGTYVKKWNGSGWTAMDSNPASTGKVSSDYLYNRAKITTDASGAPVVATSNTTISGNVRTTTNTVQRWNGTSWEDMNSKELSNVNGMNTGLQNVGKDASGNLTATMTTYNNVQSTPVLNTGVTSTGSKYNYYTYNYAGTETDKITKQWNGSDWVDTSVLKMIGV